MRLNFLPLLQFDYRPGNPNGQATMANSQPMAIASDQSAVPVEVDSLPLPTDASTETTLAAILAKIIADPATQTTLAAILAKIIAAPATEAKQDTLIAKDFATQTTLAALLAKVISAPATEAKQDTLIAKDFATQTTLAALLAKVIAAPATEAKQDTGNTSLANIDTKLTDLDIRNLVFATDKVDVTGSDVDVLTQPARSRTVDAISVADQTDAIMSGLTALTPKFAKIDRATNADGAGVVSLVSAKKIRVIKLTLMSAGTVSIKWQSSTSNTSGSGSNTDLSGLISLAANTGMSDAYCPSGLFETVAGEALKLNLNAVIQVSGYLTYIEV